MVGLEDHAHATRPDLVEHEVAADEQPFGLVLIDRGRLVARQRPRADEFPGDHLGPQGLGAGGGREDGVDAEG